MALDADHISSACRRIVKFLKKAPKRGTPKQVHGLRASIRRIEAAVESLLPNLKRSDRILMRNLGRVRKRAGKVRDMDVLTAHVASLQLTKQEEGCAVELLQFLGMQRYKNSRRLHNVAKNERQLRKDIKKLSSRLANRIAASGSNGARDVPADAMATTMQLLVDLKRPSTLTPRNLHPYRLKVKKLRDVVR